MTVLGCLEVEMLVECREEPVVSWRVVFKFSKVTRNSDFWIQLVSGLKKMTTKHISGRENRAQDELLEIMTKVIWPHQGVDASKGFIDGV